MHKSISKRTTRRFGWIPDLPDHRDLIYSGAGIKLPPRVDLCETGHMSPVYDQGQLGSCTANAWAAVLDFMRHKQGEDWINPSRLMIYYDERVIEDSVESDAGAMGRDGVKTLAKQGVCHESFWPYVESMFAEKPPTTRYAEAIKFEVLTYKRIAHTQIASIKAALSEGYPIAFGFTVYESFESDAVAENGVMPMPTKSESVVGGHEVVAVGYDDAKQLVKCRNSWGADWGDKGYFYMPYKYITSKLASDFWIIETVK